MSLEVNEIDPLWPDIEGDSIKEVFDVFWSFSQLEDYINTTIAAYYTDIYNTEFLNDVLRTDVISFSSKIGLLKNHSQSPEHRIYHKRSSCVSRY